MEAEVRNDGAIDETRYETGAVTSAEVDEPQFHRLASELEAARRVNVYQSLAMATAGHDLRQHIQNAAIAVELLRPGLVDDTYQGWLAMAQAQLACVTRALESLSREANIQAYAAHYKRSSFPISTLLARIADKWQPAADARNLCFRIDQSVVRVRSNPDLLFAVIDNLVSNAIKHTVRGSVGVYLALEGNTLLVSVQDTGPGIDTEQLKSIFQPYQRGVERHIGSGLGLAIVQNSALILDHKIRVNSLVGRGTCFTVHVPVAAMTLEPAWSSTQGAESKHRPGPLA
jgi:signal transduction histidine kinase